MNTAEYVRLTSDSNYIPVKYAVIEVSVGSSLASSYCWLKCIGLGVATKEDFDGIKSALDSSTNVDTSKMLGTLGSYSVVALSTVSAYDNVNGSLGYGSYRIG